MVQRPSRFCLVYKLLVSWIEHFKIGEEEVIMIVMNPEEGKNCGVVSRVKVPIWINIGDDNTRQLINDDEHDYGTDQHHGAEGEKTP